MISAAFAEMCIRDRYHAGERGLAAAECAGNVYFHHACAVFFRDIGKQLLLCNPCVAPDYVTQVDFAVQSYLKERLLALHPQAGFLAEERENVDCLLYTSG